MIGRPKIILAFALFICLEAILITSVDLPVSLCLRNLEVQAPWLIDIFRSYTDFGKAKWYLWPSGLGSLLVMLVMRYGNASYITREKIRQCGMRMAFLFMCVAISGIVTDIIKLLIGRARPSVMEHQGIYGLRPLSFKAMWNSMPSGHATTVFTVVFVLVHFYPQNKWLWWLCGFMLALSRIMVNAHYISDVVGGAAVAYLTVSVLCQLSNKYGMVLYKTGIFPIDRKNP